MRWGSGTYQGGLHFGWLQRCMFICTCSRNSVQVYRYTYMFIVFLHLHVKCICASTCQTILHTPECNHTLHTTNYAHPSWQTATSTNFPDRWWRERRMLSLLNKWEMTACEEQLLAPSTQNPKTPYYWVRVVNNKDNDCLILKGYCTDVIVYVKQQRHAPWQRC